MRRHEVLTLLEANRQAICERFGVSSLRVFGSVARDEAAEGSDIDILVGFADSPTFRTYMDLRIFLEDLLQAKVDLITETGLKERARPFVEKDAIRVS